MNVVLSPIEKAVLASCEAWMCLEELTGDLAPLFEPERVAGALRFLKRRQLVEGFPPTRFGAGSYRQTQLGAELLRDQRRQERHLHAL